MSVPPAKFAQREAFWRSGAPLDSVAAFVEAHPPRGLASQPASNGPGFRILEFMAGGRRYLDVTLLRDAGATFVRVQADVVWIYPRSPQEKVPAAVREVDVKAPKVFRRVTDPAQLLQIVAWFDALPVSPPGVTTFCPALIGPRIEFVFRDESGARLASASAPSLGKAGICSAIGFSIHGKQQPFLIDAYRGHGFVYRVQRLLGVQLTSLRGEGRPTVKEIAAAHERAAGLQAKAMLKRVALPAGARRVREPGALSRPDTGVSVINEIAWRFSFWRVRMPLDSVLGFVKAHPPRGFAYEGGGGTYQSLDFNAGPAGSNERILTVDLARARGATLVRLEAGVGWIYPRSPAEVVPAGVRAIDISDSPVRRHVADPAKVAQIVRWFDALNVVQPGTSVVGCTLGASSQVTFDFRSAGGAVLARAVAPAGYASSCYPIRFTIGGKRQTPLIDRTFGKGAFVYRLQRLLGVCFRGSTRACR